MVAGNRPHGPLALPVSKVEAAKAPLVSLDALQPVEEKLVHMIEQY